MENWFITAGIALCLLSLWAVARHDWLRLTRPSRRVVARVTRHRISIDDSAPTYAAVFSFTDERGPHEVTDSVYSAKPRPPVGTSRELRYPAGHPELARPPRLLMWTMIYAVLLGMTGLLVARAVGWQDHGDSAYSSREIPG